MSNFDTSPRLASPRIAALYEAFGRLGRKALESFWQDITNHGAPIVEPDADDQIYRLVTFVWRADSDLDNVVLISDHLNGWWWNGFAASKLDSVSGTNLWYRTYRIRADARFLYRFAPNHSLIHPDFVEDLPAYRASHQPDPFNSHQFVYPKDEENPESSEDVWSVVVLPAAPSQPYIVPRPGVPLGELELHRRHSAILQNDRRIWVYTPPGHSQHQPAYPGLFLVDGWYYTSVIPTATILDNLIADARIPPCVAVMIETSRDRGRDLNGYEPFNDFLCHELVPWIRQAYNVTVDPAQTIVGGLSLGGVAAAYAALQRPDIFGNVLGQSGAFWNGKMGIAEEEWLASEVASRDPLQVRFYLEAGLFENQRDTRTITILRANRHLRTVLEAKSYRVHYLEYNGGHRALSWRGSLADGLIALMGG